MKRARMVARIFAAQAMTGLILPEEVELSTKAWKGVPRARS